jgi:hypothetical protein
MKTISKARPGNSTRVLWGAKGALLMGVLMGTSGCMAAVGAAMAVGEIRQGIAGVQQLVAGSRSLLSTEVALTRELSTPLAGTYRGFQVLGTDTAHYFIRTQASPVAPILDQAGNINGYVLAGIAAANLETLERRVGTWAERRDAAPGGRAMFFVEGTQAPDPNARNLYPAAFLGRLARGESPQLDRQAEALRELEIEIEAPTFRHLEGQGIPHELFGTVAEGLFTLRPDGAAVFRQEYEVEDGTTLILHFERISSTTLPGDS